MRRSKHVLMRLASGAAIVIALNGSHAVADPSVSIRSVNVEGFPLVRMTISMDEGVRLDRSEIRVVENGVPVRVMNVDPLGGSSGDVDAVLVVDTSNSMAGPELRTALAAARTFVQGVPPSLPIGVVSFAADPVVRSPISDDRAAVERVVASLTATTSQGTALFESVVEASGMFSGSGQHNLILLTDGRCRADPSGSGPCALEGDLDEAVTAANEAGVNVFTIGLSETESAVPTLATLAERTGGGHSIISLDELEGVYAGLARELSQQYVVTYRSKAPHGAPVNATVEVGGSIATTAFLTPGTIRVPVAPQNDPVTTTVVSGPVGMAAVAVLTFLAILGLTVFVSDAVNRRRREEQLRSRLVGTVGSTHETADDAESGATLIPTQLYDAAERTVGTDRGRSLARRLEQAGWSIRAGEFLAIVLFAVLGAATAGWLLVGPIGAALGLVVAVVAPFTALGFAAGRRLAAIQSQLADTLMVIASSMRAGHSFLQSLDSAAKEIAEPAAGEFNRALSEVRLGRDVDAALDSLAERVGSQDLEWAVTAIKIQRKVGGNLAEVLETVANTIRERETLRRQVKVMSAEGRISIAVLTALPAFVTLYLMAVNPAYLRTLTGTRLGMIMISVSGCLMVIGYVWMKKIVRLDG